MVEHNNHLVVPEHQEFGTDLVEQFVSVENVLTEQVDPITKTTGHYLAEVSGRVIVLVKAVENGKAVILGTRGFPKPKQPDMNEFYHHTNLAIQVLFQETGVVDLLAIEIHLFEDGALEMTRYAARILATKNKG